MSEDEQRDSTLAVSVLLSQCDQHWEEMRHIESQRSTLTNLILVLSTAIVAFLSQRGISTTFGPLSFFLCFLGLFGVIATFKLYERHRFAQNRLNEWYKKLDELAPDASFLKLREVADSNHLQSNGIMRKLSLHLIWLLFYITLIAFGLIMYFVR